MIGMADNLLQWRIRDHASVCAQEAGGEVDADKPAAVADHRELVVGEVARMRADRMRIRMGSDKRRVAEGSDIPKPCFVDMRKIDKDF
jgi:hypothetical protein